MNFLYSLFLVIFIFTGFFHTKVNAQTACDTDSLICDVQLNGYTIPGFEIGDTVFYVGISYNDPIPALGFILCDTSLTFDNINITTAVGIPGTSVFVFNCDSIYSATYFIHWYYDGFLDGLSFDTGMLCPEFNPYIFNYVLELDSSTTLVPTVNAFSLDTNEIVTINNVGSIPGTMTIVVEDTVTMTSNTYSIEIGGDCGLGISEEIPELFIYPNPVRDILYLNTPTENILTAYILDMSGRIVQNHSITQQTEHLELDVSQLQAGVYILEYQTLSGKSSKIKWIKY